MHVKKFERDGMPGYIYRTQAGQFVEMLDALVKRQEAEALASDKELHDEANQAILEKTAWTSIGQELVEHPVNEDSRQLQTPEPQSPIDQNSEGETSAPALSRDESPRRRGRPSRHG